MPTATGAAAEPVKAPAETPHVARIISSDSIPVGGFTPGTILADRYRIIGLLGRGGMGEVYRADDLKLGQAVALKFLPPKLAQDPVRRERFFAEVRITRQLSHPNICRVYDIGEIDGRHFLSMEFIDGEDLASLLKRIGYLSNEKALDIARQLAAGLAAAHERGVLHRDLKPANIMLDGHGRVRITDFGLAIAVDEATDAAEIAGTPAYMSPEQLAGKGATVRSDIYSLGLVLYEIYTGKKAFAATNLAELRQQKETHTPRAISELREGMDPVVERLIRRCMERDPNARPSSVAQLALALPGGDPLAAALAAGETPSPEMVAASGGKEGLRPVLAWGILAFILLGALAILWMNDRTMLHRRIPFKKSADALVERSQTFLIKAGYSENFADRAFGFMVNTAFLNYLKRSDKDWNRRKNLDAKTILFWYRQSPRALGLPTLSRWGVGVVSSNNPPMGSQGEILIVLDAEGHLISFRAVPSRSSDAKGMAEVPDWTVFFAEASLDPALWNRTDRRQIPPFYADSVLAWRGPPPKNAEAPVSIEAAAFQGMPVSFEIQYPWTPAEQTGPPQQKAAEIPAFVGLALTAFLIGGVFFALRNLRLGRGDRRSATRIAILAGGLITLGWTLGTNHNLTHWAFEQFLTTAGILLFVGGVLWTLYIAIEPFVRRRWPQVLVSWTRLLSGDWRDSVVARDILIGSAFGVLCCFIGYSPPLFRIPGMDQLTAISFETLLGIRFDISVLLMNAMLCIWSSLFLICTLFLLRVLFRNQKAALVLFILLWGVMYGFPSISMTARGMLSFAALLFVLMRFGIVSVVFCEFIFGLLSGYPATLDTSAWYFGYGFIAIAMFVVIVLYAFRYSLGGRPLLASSRLDD
jgi:hypothetical protein